MAFSHLAVNTRRPHLRYVKPELHQPCVHTKRHMKSSRHCGWWLFIVNHPNSCCHDTALCLTHVGGRFKGVVQYFRKYAESWMSMSMTSMRWMGGNSVVQKYPPLRLSNKHPHLICLFQIQKEMWKTITYGLIGSYGTFAQGRESILLIALPKMLLFLKCERWRTARSLTAQWCQFPNSSHYENLNEDDFFRR